MYVYFETKETEKFINIFMFVFIVKERKKIVSSNAKQNKNIIINWQIIVLFVMIS